MSCDACKRIHPLTGKPCAFCGRLNVEAEIAVTQLEQLQPVPAKPPSLAPCSGCDAARGKTRNILGDTIACHRCKGSASMPAGQPCAACGMASDEPLRCMRAVGNDPSSTVLVCRLCWHGETHTIQVMIKRRRALADWADGGWSIYQCL